MTGRTLGELGIIELAPDCRMSGLDLTPHVLCSLLRSATERSNGSWRARSHTTGLDLTARVQLVQVGRTSRVYVRAVFVRECR